MKLYLIYVPTMLLLAGCSSTITKVQESQLSSTISALRATVFDEQKDSHFARTEFLFSQDLILNNEKKSKKWNFPGFVCAPLGRYDLQQAAFGIVEAVNDAYVAAYAKPSDDIGELFSNVFRRQNSIPQFPKGETGGGEKVNQVCRAEVEEDLKQLNALVGERVLPIGAIIGIYGAAKSVWNAVKSLIVITLQQVDSMKKESELLTFIGKDDVHTQMKEALGSCVLSAENISDDDLRKCLKDDTSSPLSNAQIGLIIQNKRIAAIARPAYIWHEYTQEGKYAEIRQQLIINQPNLDMSLADYDELRKRRVDPDGHFNLVKGWLEMRRIALGKLSGTERTRALYQGMLRFVQGGGAVFNAANGVNDSVKKLKDAVDEL